MINLITKSRERGEQKHDDEFKTTACPTTGDKVEKTKRVLLFLLQFLFFFSLFILSPFAIHREYREFVILCIVVCVLRERKTATAADVRCAQVGCATVGPAWRGTYSSDNEQKRTLQYRHV